jgi:hypothetical protein
MTNCLQVLTEEGEDLRGYSPDTIVSLQEESLPADECEKLLALKEVLDG